MFLLSMTLSGIAFAQQGVKDKTFFDAITYQWQDADDNVHTSKLTDVAKDPRQIMAMLKEVFTNTKIPGIYYGGYKADGTTREGAVSYDLSGDSNYQAFSNLTSTGVGQWSIRRGVYYPEEEGYTTLMVFVKNSWDNSQDTAYSVPLDYINASIDSVKLMYDATRLDKNANTPNPGTIYKLSGSANRFFFISKGRARRGGGTDNDDIAGRMPFYGMFEEYSPVSTSASIGLENFYAKMTGGETFAVDHDCGSVPGTGHYFCMSGVNGTEQFVLNDLAFFIPDLRLKSWADRDYQRNPGQTSHHRYTNYNPDNAPTTGLHGIRLEGRGMNPDPDDGTKWKITLDWTSMLDEITGNTVDEDFYIFVKDPDTGELTPLLDENGEQVPMQKGYTYTYLVDREEHGRNITYVVKGKPTIPCFSEVQSNEAKVGVPGLDENERLILGITSESESNYILSQEVNQYKNYVSMSNAQGTYISASNIAPGKNPQFTFYRYPNRMSILDSIPFATMTITDVYSSGGKYYYNYQVSYDNQVGADESSYPAKTGTFTCVDDADSEVDFGEFKVCDQFNASTADNDHPEKYYYRVKFTNNELDGDDYHSAFNDIKVFKTAGSIEEQKFTLTQVAADSVRSTCLDLNVQKPHLNIELESDFAIERYEAHQVKNKEANESDVFGHAQRLADAGQYGIYEGENHVGDVAHSQGAHIRHHRFGCGSGYFFPVIKTYRGDPQQAIFNTYGAPILPITHVEVNATVTETKASTYTFIGDEKGRYYSAKFEITPDGVDMEDIVKFRIWRLTEDGVAIEEKENYMPRLRQDSHPVDIVMTEGKPAIADYQKPEFYINGVENIDVLPYSKVDGIFAFDVFGAKLLEQGETMPVSYLIRMYCKPSTEGNGSSGMKRRAGEAEEYYIAEKTIDVMFSNDTPTDVDNVNVTKQLRKTVYVNPLGQVSDAPHEGVNIIINTYTDGTVVKTKKVF